MATSRRGATSTRRSSSSRSKVKTTPQRSKTKEAKSGPKRLLSYAVVVVILLIGFYAVRTFQMAQHRSAVDQQIKSAAAMNATDLVSLKDTLDQIHKQYPQADQYSADPVFSQAPMAGRLANRDAMIIADGENEIKANRDRTPFMYLTDFIMPGAQQSTDDYFRNSLNTYVHSAEYIEFNSVKLKVDDLMSGVNFCRKEATQWTYGYMDPEPDEKAKAERTAVINEAAKRHLCP